MSPAADVPGAPELAAIAAQVSGSPTAIRAIAQSWSQAADSCELETTAVNQRAAAAADGWTGVAEEEFDRTIAQFGVASSNQQECLRAGAQALNDAADALETAQTQISSISSTLQGQLTLLSKGEAKGVPAATVLAAQNYFIAQATSQAQQAAATAGDAMDQASQVLVGVLSAMQGSHAFSALPVPTASGFPPGGSTGGSGPS